MRRASLLVAGVAITLSVAVSGCVSESADLGRPPPIVIETPGLVLNSLPRTPPDAAAPARIRQAILRVGGGNIQSVRARIYARSDSDAEALRRSLVGIGMDPARLTVEPKHSPKNQLVLTRAIAGTTPCADAITLVAPDDPLPSLMSLGHCTQRNNLAQMLVDPGDLVAPPSLAAEDGQYLVDGVQSWRKNRSTPLPSQDESTSGVGSGGVGGGSATPTTAPATTATGSAAPVTSATAPANAGQ